MKSPIDILHETNILDERMRKRISGYYRHRGEKALEIVDDDRVKRYRDFFVVVGETGNTLLRGIIVHEDFLTGAPSAPMYLQYVLPGQLAGMN